jgi:hypothetical protein
MGVTTDRNAPCLNENLPDGQHKCHIVLPDEERAKGYVRPLRIQYKHVGIAGPEFPLRDLKPDEQYHRKLYVKFEEYPPELQRGLGRFWTQEQLDKIGKGCGVVTRMPEACAETYARQPSFYGSTFCCGCHGYLPVGADGEFVWLDDGTRVGT